MPPSKNKARDKQAAKAKQQQEKLRRATMEVLKAQVVKPLTAASGDKDQLIRAIEDVELTTRKLARQSRHSYYCVLGTAYFTYHELMKLDEDGQEEVVAMLVKRVPKSRVKKPEPLRLLLHRFIDYQVDGERAGKAISRDCIALSYALNHRIPARKFVARIAAEGEGLDKWSRRSAKQVSGRSGERGASCPNGPATRAAGPASVARRPPTIDLAGFVKDLEKILTRDGSYFFVGRLRGKTFTLLDHEFGGTDDELRDEFEVDQDNELLTDALAAATRTYRTSKGSSRTVE